MIFNGCINEWKNIILTGNSENLINIIDDNAVFYSPVVFNPQKGKKIVIKYLSTAVKIFQEKQFRYVNDISSENSTYAEFQANFNNIFVNGIDYINTKNNLIIEFKVFLRPLKGTEVVWNEMRKKFSEEIN